MAEKITRDILRSIALDVDAFEIMAFSVYTEFNTELFRFIGHVLTRRLLRSSMDRWLERLFCLAKRILAARDERVVFLSRDPHGSGLVFVLPVLLFDHESPTHVILAVASCQDAEDAGGRRNRLARLIQIE